MLTVLLKNCSSYWGLSYCIYLNNITKLTDINLGIGAKDFQPMFHNLSSSLTRGPWVWTICPTVEIIRNKSQRKKHI